MVKKQQMQWSSHGAHYLLQARTATRNGDFSKNFERWYPGLNIDNVKGEKSQEWKMAA